MTVGEIVALLVGATGLLSALAAFYGIFIAPIKRAMQMIEHNDRRIQSLESQIDTLKRQREDDNAFSGEVKSLMLESLMAILEALEQSGAGSQTSAVKKKLIEFLSKLR